MSESIRDIESMSPTSSTKTAPKRRRGYAAALAGIGVVLALWSLVSGSYILFHDSMLAALLSRQSEMQYAYEDRIAELRGALEAASAQTLRDGRVENGALRELAARGDRLETRLEGLQALLGEPARPGELRLHAASGGDSAAAITARFAELEARGSRLVGALRARTDDGNTRTQSALAALGLAPAPRGAGATGGPFVPLAADALTPEQDLALLGDALARRRQLDAVAAHLPLRQPVAGPLEVTSGFGARSDPFYHRLALHTGVDLREDYGSPVRAVAAGTVTIAGPQSGYGTLIEIDHGNGYATRYAHLSALAVKVGDRVAAGATVGQVGTTGRSTGPHLHYEVRIAGEPVDPARYLDLAATMQAP